MYNNFLLKRANIKLKVGDTFSIRKYGKFKFNGIIGTSKSNINRILNSINYTKYIKESKRINTILNNKRY